MPCSLATVVAPPRYLLLPRSGAPLHHHASVLRSLLRLARRPCLVLDSIALRLSFIGLNSVASVYSNKRNCFALAAPPALNASANYPPNNREALSLSAIRLLTPPLKFFTQTAYCCAVYPRVFRPVAGILQPSRGSFSVWRGIYAR